MAGRKINIFFSIKSVPVILCFLFLLHKIAFFIFYSLRYTDHDQVTVWLMASDYARGNFGQLFFYGQNYNVALDAWFSVPLIKAGISPVYAPDIVCFTASISSVLLFWYYLFKNRKYVAASMVALVFLLAPFTMMYQYSAGISLGVHLCFILFTIYLIRPCSIMLFLTLFVCTNMALGVKNALPFLGAICIFILPAIRKDLRWVYNLLWISGIVCGALFFWVIFERNTGIGNMLHTDLLRGFSFANFLQNIQNIHQMFWGLGPIIDFLGILYFLFIAMMAFVYRRKNPILVYTNIAFLALTLVSFGFEKTADGHLNAYFPYVRFFLGVIPLAMLNFSEIPENMFPGYLPKTFLIAGIAGVIIFYSVFENSRINHKNRNLSTRISEKSKVLKEARKPEKTALWKSGVLCISMDDPGTMYIAQVLYPKANTLYLPYDRRHEKYRKFYTSELTDCYLVNHHIQYRDTMIAGYTLRRTADSNSYIYHIHGKGLTAGQFMEKANWQYYLKLQP